MIEELYNHNLLNLNALPSTYTAWVRNSQWLSMPTVAATENKVVILMRISPLGGGLSNFARFNFSSTFSGTFTVNWGDGTSGTFAGGANADKQYDFAAIDSGTTMSDGNRQVLITITSSSAFQSFSFATKHPSLATYAESNFLDMIISAPSAATITLGSSSGTLLFNLLERVQIISSAVTTFANIFNSVRSLQSFTLTSSATVTSLLNAFSNCFLLQYVPLLSFYSTITTTSGMFTDCRNLRLVEGPLNLTAATTTANMFQNCRNLVTAPVINLRTSGSVTTADMFNGCSSLQAFPVINLERSTSVANFALSTGINKVPNINISNATTASAMFSSCAMLTKLGTITSSSTLTDTSSMFASCVSLRSAPTITVLTSVTTTASMFSSCSELTYVPNLNVPALQTATSMFANCVSLKTAPTLTGSAFTTLTSMFSACASLTTVPEITTSVCTAFTSMFSNCGALRTVQSTFTHSSASSTAIGSMFFNCFSLVESPTFNCTSTGTISTIASTFSGCNSLEKVNSIPCSAISATSGTTTAFSNAGIKYVTLSGIKFGFTVASSSLSASALVDLFNSLGTATSQTLVITGNYGAASLTAADRLIATNKGWTLTG